MQVGEKDKAKKCMNILLTSHNHFNSHHGHGAYCLVLTALSYMYIPHHSLTHQSLDTTSVLFVANYMIQQPTPTHSLLIPVKPLIHFLPNIRYSSLSLYQIFISFHRPTNVHDSMNYRQKFTTTNYRGSEFTVKLSFEIIKSQLVL